MNLLIDNTINQAIGEKLVAANKEKEAKHKSSGKLSASMLSWSLQWQILKLLGVGQTPYDAYTLRKFKRGTEIEDWLVKQMPGVIEEQKFVEYRNTVGYVDAVVDTKDYEHKKGIIPHEIKSVTNKKYSWIAKQDRPDDAHLLQASLYAMAMETGYFAIDYVASDDLRVTSFVVPLGNYLKGRVNKIIDDFGIQWAKKEIPVFEPLYAWQKNKTYSKYPEWAGLAKKEIKEKMERLKIKFP